MSLTLIDFFLEQQAIIANNIEVIQKYFGCREAPVYERTDIDGVECITFLKGSHDTDFVYNDIVKVLNNRLSGGFVMSPSFNPALRKNVHWIDDVCKGVEKLYRKGHLSGQIVLLKDSLGGLYGVS